MSISIGYRAVDTNREAGMGETPSHRRAKNKAAGRSGRTEVPLKSGKRLDARTPKRATEVERSGTSAGLARAAQRLKESRASQKVLQVPQKDMAEAAEAMKAGNVSGTVKNMSGTKRRSVRGK